MFNGSSTQKGADVGIVISSPRGNIWRLMCKLGDQTFNIQAKYNVLIIRLDILATMKVQYHEIRRDSQLVIKQVTREYKCYNAKLKKLHALAHKLLKLFADIVIMYIPCDDI